MMGNEGRIRRMGGPGVGIWACVVLCGGFAAGAARGGATAASVRTVGATVGTASAGAVGTHATADPNNPSVLTLDRIFTRGDFNAKSPGAIRWWQEGIGYTMLEPNPDMEDARDLVLYTCEEGRRRVLVSAAELIPDGADRPLAIRGYAWSKDGRRVLIFTNTRRVWRQHTRGDYWVFDRNDGRLVKLGGGAEEASLMFATFSPDGRLVAYVCKNDLYVQDVKTLAIRRLTRDGGETTINGTSDWVNEEELGIRKGFVFSPDGRFIAFWRFDTSGVERFALIDYTSGLYPRIKRFPYPKAGQVNSAVSVGVVSVEGGSPRFFDMEGDPRNLYVADLQWHPSGRGVVIQQLNRLQNTNQVRFGPVGVDWFGQPTLGRWRTMFTDRDEAWVDVGSLEWVDEGQAFCLLSERDGWRQIWQVREPTSQPRLPCGATARTHGAADVGPGASCEVKLQATGQCVTPGAYDVVNIAGVDRQRGWVYFIASPDDPKRRYLYAADRAGHEAVHRITPEGPPGTHGYDISPDGRWAIHTVSTFETPPVTELVRLPGHERVRVLEDNAELKDKLAALRTGPVEFFQVEIEPGVVLDGWCLKPPDFDPSRRYPLLFYVYGEPAGQTVADRWPGRTGLWHRMLAQRGCVVMSVDNRGTKVPRGRAWRKCIYRQIGILASADQAAAARRILAERPWLDPQRVGIWGWSGGGSMTLNAMFRYPEVYHVGVAVAFVANERYYDTIYQERYMGLPEDNEEGYTQGSPITFADRLRGDLLLVYGTGDDNCHVQNCHALINELVKHGRSFSLMLYPNRTHSIGEGKGTRRHLYGTMTRYLQEHLLAPPVEAP